MFTADKRILSISITENIIKIAQVKSSGTVEKVIRQQASSQGPDDLLPALKTALNGFDRKAMVVCTIPAANATSKSIEVPSTDPQEIKSIISLQASRHTPYSRDEIILGYYSICATESNGTRVMLVIVHRNVVKERITLLEKAGLNPEKILFVAEGIGHFYHKALSLKKDAAPIGLIDVALNGITYMVLAKGSVAFARHIPLGIKAIMEGADTQAKLIEEFNKSVAGFVNEDIDMPPEKYMVTTEHEVIKGVLPTLGQQLSVVFELSPFTNFIKAAPPVKTKLTAEYGDESFLDVITSGFSAPKAEVNLLPDEIVMRRQFEHQSNEVMKAAGIGVVLMMLIGGIVISKSYFKQAYLDRNLRSKYAEERKEVKELELTQEKNRVVRDYLTQRMLSLEALRGLYEVTPKEIYLGNIAMDEAGLISIDGMSDTMSRVYSYVKSLEDSSMFKMVKTKSTATKKDKGKDVASFEIVMKLEAEK